MPACLAGAPSRHRNSKTSPARKASAPTGVKCRAPASARRSRPSASAQSAAYELQRQEYNYWGWDRKSAELLAPDALPAAGAGPVAWLMALIYRLYVVGQLQMAGVAMEFRKKLGAILAAQPLLAADIRDRYRATFAPSVFRWSIMSANYRTLGIFIAALAGRPLYYFWFEIVGMSLLTLLLIAGQRLRYRRFIAAIESCSRP